MIRLTDEQRRAAIAGERSVAVVAGAGTGKTRVLTERYLHLVLERDVEITRVLAVTFTEKAAREMKDRIRAALVHAGRRDLARASEFAPISTIHAFLARVLRERAIDAGIDPRFVIADEMAADVLLEQALAETIEELEPDLRGTLVDLTGGEDCLLDLYLAARATPHAMGELRPVEPDLEGLRVRTKTFLDACAGQAAGGKTGERLAGLGALTPRLLDLDPAAGPEFGRLVSGNVATAQRELFAKGRALRPDWLSLAYLESSTRVGAAVVEALGRLDDRYTELKRADALLDFSDLERKGLALLRSDTGAAVAAEFDHLLVDEYQDTSRIQEAILDCLASSCARFGVGDAKQSIYRFRYADAGVFAELQGEAARHALEGSFRSRPELLEFTNALFRGLFAGSEVEAQDLRPEAEWRAKAAGCVEVITLDAQSAPAARRFEARALARRLREIVEGRGLQITRADEEERDLTYTDCALLLRATTHLTVYERALAEAGVPYVVIKGRGYYAAREVVDLAHLLLLLGDPRDDYRAIAVMTSLLCGVPDQDLLHLPGDGPMPLRALAGERPDAIPPDRWRRLQTFAERFDRWRAMAAQSDCGDLVEAILNQTRFADLLLLEPDGRRRHANLHKALRRARTCRQDPETYARSLLEFRERERRESEAPVASESDEAVKVMTVHAAKGLEFPLVAAADLTAKRRASSGPLLHPGGVFGFKLRDNDRSVDPPGLAGLREWDKRQEESEYLRLLYVAFTRAQEHLVLSGATFPNCDRSLLDALPVSAQRLDVHPLLAADERRRSGAAVRAALRRGADLPASLERDDVSAEALLSRIAAMDAPEVDVTPYVAAAADLLEFDRCPRKYRLGRAWGIEIEDPEEFGERSGVDEHPRRALGTAFHGIMEEIGPGAMPEEATVLRHLPDARPGDLKKIREWSAWLAEQGFVQKLPEHEREMGFLARIEGLAVRGVIDLYDPSVPLLVDYKTSASVRADEYSVQVAVYLAALRALGRKTPDSGLLVYVDAREIIEVPEVPVAPLIERFRAAHRGGGGFPPAPGSACAHCEFRSACEGQGVACPTGL
ncbi:MAG: UvrD-helicase domain-containing protein [Planctomycetota bacterium]